MVAGPYGACWTYAYWRGVDADDAAKGSWGNAMTYQSVSELLEAAEKARRVQAPECLACVCKTCAHDEQISIALEATLREQVARIAELEAQLAAHEKGEPTEGSRLWRCEKELAKARASLEAIRTALGGGPEDDLVEAAKAVKHRLETMCTNYDALIVEAQRVKAERDEAIKLLREARDQVDQAIRYDVDPSYAWSDIRKPVDALLAKAGG